jgi:LysM repeat protein
MKYLKFLVVIFVFTIAVSCGQQKRFITYKIKQGETMRSIAKKLDMKTKDLLRLNPDVGRRPKPNTEIFIPKNKSILVFDMKEDKEGKEDIIEKDTIRIDSIKKVIDVEDLSNDFVLHKVSKGDTFYSLTRYYNVLKSDLISLNPTLEEGLKLGATIKIKKIVEGEDVDVIYKDTISNEATVKLALLLPFRAKLFDTIPANEIFKDRNRNLANIVTDFYLGAELAIDSLKSRGVQIEMQVFDTEDRNTKIDEFIADRSFQDKDAIIGSIYSDETKKLSNSVNAPLIFPVFSRAQTSFTSSKIVKTSPDKHLYKEKLLSHVSKSYKNENIIIVGDSTQASIIEVNQIANILKQHDSINEVHTIIPHYGYIAQERFLKMMKPDTTNITNWVILATNNNVTSSDAINSLISFPDPPEPEDEDEEPQEKINYTVKLFGFEKTGFVDNEKLAQLQFVYVTDTYIDEASTTAIQFNKHYLRKNKALPSYYATRGFDVTYDIGMRLASGKKLSSTFKDGVSYRVESKFDYNKRLFSISENRGLYLLEFQTDLSIKRLE